VALGRALVGAANAAIDISDGLLADLGHILERSGVGAELRLETMPFAPALSAHAGVILECALAGGDDYELCFTAPQSARAEVLRASLDSGVAASWVGTITAAGGLSLLDAAGKPWLPTRLGFDHFGSRS
jgi:thiamine-monophosphate kinase